VLSKTETPVGSSTVEGSGVASSLLRRFQRLSEDTLLASTENVEKRRRGTGRKSVDPTPVRMSRELREQRRMERHREHKSIVGTNYKNASTCDVHPEQLCASIGHKRVISSSSLRGMIHGIPKDFLAGDLPSAEFILGKRSGRVRYTPGEVPSRMEERAGRRNSLLKRSASAPGQSMRSARTPTSATALQPLTRPPQLGHLAGPILFTAPHGIKLFRGQAQPGENIRVHKVERWCTEIALRLAESMPDLLGFEGSSMVWDISLVSERPNPANLDPNYLSIPEFAQSPWHQMLCRFRETHPAEGLLHVDVHGKRDRKSNWDLDVGMQPMMKLWPDQRFVHMFLNRVCDEMEKALQGTKYTVNRSPTLCGWWGGDCHTISHQSVLLGTPALQLEIPRSLRADLVGSDQLFSRFAAAIATAFKEVIRPLGPTPPALLDPRARTRLALIYPNSPDLNFQPPNCGQDCGPVKQDDATGQTVVGRLVRRASINCLRRETEGAGDEGAVSARSACASSDDDGSAESASDTGDDSDGSCGLARGRVVGLREQCSSGGDLATRCEEEE